MNNNARYICLSSAASLEIYTNNTSSSFSNTLPTPLLNRQGKKFYIKLHSIGLCPFLAEDQAEENTSYMQVSIHEVEGQIIDRKVRQVVGGFAFPPTQDVWEERFYSFHTFSESPLLQVRFQELRSLRVELTDADGKHVRLAKGPPTIILLKIMESEEVSEEFTITSSSFHPDLFPANNLAEFTAPLVTEMDLTDYAVCLHQVVFPLRMDDEAELAILKVQNTQFRYQLTNFPNTEEFLERVQSDLAGSPWRNQLVFDWVRGPSGEARRAVLARLAVPNLDQSEPMQIAPNQTFTRACGQMTLPRDVTLLRPGRVIAFEGTPNIFLGVPLPIAMLECDIIKPNIMNASQSNLLECVPVLERRTAGENRLYEPKQRAFHPINNRPFNTIKFKFANPDGSVKKFSSQSDTDMMLITLLFRKI